MIGPMQINAATKDKRKANKKKTCNRLPPFYFAGARLAFHLLDRNTDWDLRGQFSLVFLRNPRRGIDMHRNAISRYSRLLSTAALPSLLIAGCGSTAESSESATMDGPNVKDAQLVYDIHWSNSGGFRVYR